MGINFITSQIRKSELMKSSLEKKLSIAKAKRDNVLMEHQTNIEFLESQIKTIDEIIDRYKKQTSSEIDEIEIEEVPQSPNTILTSTNSGDTPYTQYMGTPNNTTLEPQ